MKKPDKFLIAIVAGIVLLIAAAFLVVLLQPSPEYQAEDTPEGVTHNYLLALQREEYDRAYRYLSPSLPGYPHSPDTFYRDVGSIWSLRDLQEGSVTLTVESSQITGERAVVSVRQTTFYGGELFDSGQSTSFLDVDLRLEEGEWKIVGADRYWYWCWSTQSREHCPTP